MTDIAANLRDVSAKIEAAAARAGRRADEVTLIAVTKLHDPEEIAEAIEEAVEAAEQTENPAAGEVSAVMEEILDPVASVILENEADEEEQELPEVLRTGDALRAALAAVRPVLARMPRNMRRKMAGDIAANLRRARGRGTTGADAYAALASARRRTAPASAELGKKIMASRNSNYRKSV